MKKKTAFHAAVLLVLLAVPFLWLDFASWRGQPSMNVTMENLVWEDNRFSMTVSQGGNSGSTFRRASWKIEDGTLYVTLFSGLARGGFDRDTMDVEIEDNGLRGVQQVCLQGGSSTRLIYSK